MHAIDEQENFALCIDIRYSTKSPTVTETSWAAWLNLLHPHSMWLQLQGDLSYCKKNPYALCTPVEKTAPVMCVRKLLGHYIKGNLCVHKATHDPQSHLTAYTNHWSGG